MARSRKSSDNSEAEDAGRDDTQPVEDSAVTRETGPGEEGERPKAPEEASERPDETRLETDAPDDDTLTEVGAVGAEMPLQDSAADEPAAEEPKDDQHDAGEDRETSELNEATGEGPEHEPGEQATDDDRPDLPEENAEALSARPDDETVEASPSSESPPPVSTQAQPATSRGAGGAIALVFGGIVAALIGFAASRYILPELWTGQTAELEQSLAAANDTIAAQSQQIEDLRSTLDGLTEEVQGLGSSDEVTALSERLDQEVSSFAGVNEQLGAVASRLDTLTGQVTDLADRVEQIELRPTPEAFDTQSLDAEIAAFRDELSQAVEDARSEMMAAQEEAAQVAVQAAEDAAALEAQAAEEAAAREAEAAAAEQAAQERAALSRISAALESGEPFEDDVALLTGDVPEPLSSQAAAGVPTLASLQESFPDAAREALQTAIRENVDGDAVDRFMAFLRVQTGARSLEPRAGDDPDAVLSRAEAALDSGDLPAALSELEALPPSARPAMADWIAAAQTRLAALQARADLTASANAN